MIIYTDNEGKRNFLVEMYYGYTELTKKHLLMNVRLLYQSFDTKTRINYCKSQRCKHSSVIWKLM